MRRKFAFLSTVGVLLALAAPAASGAAMWPPNFKFEIVGDSHGPKLTTSLGSCSLTKITGQIPASPANESGNLFQVPTPVPGACTAGASITLAGVWSFMGNQYITQLVSNTEEAVTLRYTSLPGCKLVGRPSLTGVWSNGVKPEWSGGSAAGMKSGYHADAWEPFTWKEDKAACALKNQTEKVHYETSLGAPYPASNVVNDLTIPSTPIIVR